MKIQHCLLAVVSFVVIGCSHTATSSEIKVGLLLEDTIDDEGWNSKGYQGLLNIHNNTGMNVVFKEDIKTDSNIERAIREFEEEGVKLLFGHGRIFAEYFAKVSDDYPNIHFVSFNDETEGRNVTNISFNSYAMGYFAGYVASSMSETGHVGVIGAFPWQPETSGFTDGALASNPNIVTHIRYVNSWIDEVKALDSFIDLKEEGVDVFYPTGDGFHVTIIEEAKKEGLYIIGYVSDQSDLGELTVLTSTIQHVDRLYEHVAKEYLDGTLEAGNVKYGFEDGIVSLAPFSKEVPTKTKEEIEEAIKVYIDSGELPTEQVSPILQ